MSRLDQQTRDVLVDLVTQMQAAAATMTELVARVRGMAVNDCLGTELVALDAAGTWTRDFQVPYASVAVANHHAATAITVTDAPLAAAAPTAAVGAALVGAGRLRVVNLTGNVLSIYGAAGAQVTVSVFTKPQPPSAGQI